MGVDVCYTNHAEVDPDDTDALMLLLGAAGCSFVIAVPGSDDVMLHYQSLSFSDVLTVRQVLGLRPAPEFEAWLRQRLRDNAPYDRLVRELLRVPDDAEALRSTPADRRTLWVFLQANEFKPANLAGSTARSARQASLPWPVSRREGAPKRPTSPTE